MSKYKFISDKNKKSLKIKSFIKNRLEKLKPKLKFKKINFVIGGDGFMLNILKKYSNNSNQFYGVNSGNYGFLMNRFSKSNFINDLKKLKLIKINPLLMSVINVKKKKNSFLAINEVSILRQSKQTASIFVKVNKKILIKKLISDGLIISTPAGSTAYNLSVYGPILSLNSKKLSIIPISPFRPRRWKGRIINDSHTVYIKNLDFKKRPISVVADNIEIRNALRITVKSKKNISFNLLYNSNRSLEKKIKLEQIKREVK